jgi:two-component system chemotaxis response regulator CheY
MVTAEATKDTVLQAIKAGTDDYLVKPFTSTRLRQKIDALLAKYALYA